MHKELVLAHYQKTITWVGNLENVTEKEWRTPIENDKWTVAEIVGHFKPWDEFVLCQRLPYLFQNKKLLKAPDNEVMNKESAAFSREHAKETIITEFIVSRKKLMKAINDLPDNLWEKEFYVGRNKHTLFSYFEALKEHDLHHFVQIERLSPYN